MAITRADVNRRSGGLDPASVSGAALVAVFPVSPLLC